MNKLRRMLVASWLVIGVTAFLSASAGDDVSSDVPSDMSGREDRQTDQSEQRQRGRAERLESNDRRGPDRDSEHRARANEDRHERHSGERAREHHHRRH